MTDKERSENDSYRHIDQTTERIDFILGKTIGKGIMPAYPFFILSVIVAYETSAIPLDQEITSQGHCYQALIYFYLRKQGVKNDEMDIYLNFLTELAFYLYRINKTELSEEEFNEFWDYLTNQFNLPIKQETIRKNLSQIASVDSFNNYSFRYPYIYYFFVAKYFAEHIEDTRIDSQIKRMVNNLHVDENAYICIFIVHHSANAKILDEIESNSSSLFDKYQPATLTKAEVSFFDEQADIIIKAALPPASISPEKTRTESLKVQDEAEQLKEDDTAEKDFLETELRRAIKTVEVIGCIIRNRAGSLEKKKLEKLFKEAIQVHLRILGYFFDLIKNKDKQKSIIDFISLRLEKINKEKDGKLSEEEMAKISRVLFWNLNFFVVCGFVNKIVRSLGSDKLTEIIKTVCEQTNTPASFLIKQGILMWYNKNLRIDEIAQRMKEKDYSEIAKRVTKLIVVHYCYFHSVSYKDRQRIESKLGIPSTRLSTRKHEES